MQIYNIFLKSNKQKPDFLHIGDLLIQWFAEHGRDLPFRRTKDPYKIWICEIIFQQTRISQGLQYYENFIDRFPDVQTLANAHQEEVLLYWKGLGYYSRAINLHKASHQIIHDFSGLFPSANDDIIRLKGVGKYTAAAIASICFGAHLPAVDGNLYRILSRFFADSKPVTDHDAFNYYSDLALKLIPPNKAGLFNEAMMDLGSEICTPKKPNCGECPLNLGCIGFLKGSQSEFPIKKGKVKVQELSITYYYIYWNDLFIINKRGTGGIWKNLYDFPASIPSDFLSYEVGKQEIRHKLTHRNLNISIYELAIPAEAILKKMILNTDFKIISAEQSVTFSFPKPIDAFLQSKISEKED